MDRCDVLIVGAGPAGASCAWALRGGGLRVVLMDKAPFPRDKVCAGWITPSVVETLQIDLDRYRAQHVLQPFRGFQVGLIGGPAVTVPYDHVASYGIRRCEFDNYLRQRSGAECRLGQAARTIERAADGWIINGTLSARMLVGAGGHFCPVASAIGEPASAMSVVYAQEVEFAIAAEQRAAVNVDPEVPQIFFCRDLRGYGWVVRKGDYLNVGLGRAGDKSVTAGMREFLQFLNERGVPGIAVPARMRGHAYRLYERAMPKLVDDRVLLVGDAAGLAHPRSGEGIGPAVESGVLAARAILQCHGRYTAERLQPYAAAIHRRFGDPKVRYVTDWIPRPLCLFLGRLLLTSRRFTRRVVLEDWFLHSGRPAIPSPQPPVAQGLATAVPAEGRD